MTPSKLQQDILDAFTETDKNLLVVARAGSGKTSTLKLLANAMPSGKTACFVAFNKAIADALQAALPARVKAATCHSIGLGEIKSRMRSAQVDVKKVPNIIKKHYSMSYDSNRHLAELVSHAKGIGFGSYVYPINGDKLQAAQELIDHIYDAYDLVIPEDFPSMVAAEMLLTVLAESNGDLTIVDFDDMIYLPIFFNWMFTKYDVLFVDEAQDLSGLQHAFVLKMGRRFCFVGDDRQAIYGFRGAHGDSMSELQAQTKALALPLTVSYRCPQLVIRDAQVIVPDITANKTNEGFIANIDVLTLQTAIENHRLDADCMIVCRNNKPLFNFALACLRARLPFKISSNFNQVLIKRLKSFKAQSVKQLEVRIKAWAEKEIDKATEKKSWGVVARTEEIRDILLDFCMEATDEGKTDVDYVVRLLEQIASGKTGVNITTIHKAKGLEAKTVYFAFPSLLPSKYATSERAIQQEMNLKYVAITRAEENLYYVE